MLNEIGFVLVIFEYGVLDSDDLKVGFVVWF